MNRTIFPFRNLAPLVITVLGTVIGTVLLTAAQAAASQPPPGRGERTGTYHGPSAASVHHMTESPVSAQSWVLFAAGILAALLVGAALMHLAQRRRAQLAH
jgi:formate/nitrite transporter FocA (FNT family)